MSSLTQKTYILSIAVSQYTRLEKLQNAVEDANLILNTLRENYEVEILPELHDISDKRDIESAFRDIEKKIQPEDALLVIYNGHGRLSEVGEISYWQLKDSKLTDESTWYKCLDFFDEIKKLERVRDIAVFVNACYSGNLFSQDGLTTAQYDNGGDRSRILFTSGVKDETVNDKNPFAKFISEYLKGKASENKVSLMSLITEVTMKFDKSHDFSMPRGGTFRQHERDGFFLYPKNNEHEKWEKIKNSENIEDYDGFISDFPNGKFIADARNKIKFLISVSKEWTELSNEVSSRLKLFREKENLPKKIVEILNEIQDKFNSIEKSSKVTISEREAFSKIQEINNDTSISDKEKYKKMRQFLMENPNNSHRSEVEQWKVNIDKKINAQEAWENIVRKIALKNVKSRKASLFEFLEEHPNSPNREEAERYYRGILFIKDAIKKIDSDDPQEIEEGKKLLKSYLNQFPKGEYRKEAQKKLDNLKIQEHANRLGLGLIDAIENNNMQKVKEIMDEINGLTDEEKNDKGIAKVLVDATSVFEKYERKKNEDFEEMLESNKIAAFKIFIEEYEKDELAQDLVKQVEEKLQDKDRELFKSAEESREISSFEDYIYELGEKGECYEDANIRINELEFFARIADIGGYQKYLQSYPDGLMLVEAQEKINEFEEEEKLFNLIEQTEGLERLNNCETYLKEFAGVYRFEKVKEIKKQVDEDLNNDDSVYQKAEEKRTKEGFNEYLNQYPKGLNKDKAEDGLFFLECLETNDIGKLEGYIEKSIVKEFEQKAKDAINRINRKNKADQAFQRIQNFNGDFEEGIRLCQVYIREYEHENEENTKLVNKKRLELKELKSEAEDFQKTKQEGSEEAYLAYLNKYHGKQAVGQEEIAKLLLEKKAGITKKDYQVSDAIKEIATETQKTGSETVNAVNNLAVEIKNSTEQNHQIFDAAIKEIATETQKTGSETVNAVNNLAVEIKNSTEQNHQIFDAAIKEIATETQKTGSETVNAIKDFAAEIKNSTEQNHQIFDAAIKEIAMETQKTGSETVNAMKDLAAEMKKSNENIGSLAARLSEQGERIKTGEAVTQEIRKEIKTTRIIIIAVLVVVLLAILFFAFL